MLQREIGLPSRAESRAIAQRLSSGNIKGANVGPKAGEQAFLRCINLHRAASPSLRGTLLCVVCFTKFASSSSMCKYAGENWGMHCCRLPAAQLINSRLLAYSERRHGSPFATLCVFQRQVGLCVCTTDVC